ncbi:ensconsin like protein [Tanacetum coccineum]
MSPTLLFSTIAPPPPLISPSLLRHSHHHIPNLRPPYKTLIPKSNPTKTTKLQSSINPDLGLVQQAMFDHNNPFVNSNKVTCPDVYSCTKMIQSYLRNNRFRDALKMWGLSCLMQCPPPLSLLELAPGLANLSVTDCGKDDPDLKEEMGKQFVNLL